MGSRFLEATLSDAAALTCSSEDASFPCENVQDEQRTKVHRFTGDTSEYYRVDFGSKKPISALAIINHNLTVAATITVKAGLTAGGDTLKNTAYAAWEPLFGFGEGGFGEHGFGGYLTPDEVATYYAAGTLRLLDWTNVIARYWEINISDPDNPAGYIQVGRLILGNFITSERFPALGMVNTPQDPSAVAYSLGGQAWKDRKTPYREAQVAFNYVPGSETYATWYAFFMRVGVGTSFVADLLPGHPNLGMKLHNQIYCHIPEGGIPGIQIPYLDRGSIEMTLRESL
jgi:hypothetical protein